MQAALVDRAFNKDIARARKTGDLKKVEHLDNQNQRWFELAMLEEEGHHAYTAQLLRTARRLRLPIPRLYDEAGGIMGDWERGSASGLLYLTESGVAKLREAIRSEARWRHESRAHWAVWLSAITGLVGALTGFLAVLSR